MISGPTPAGSPHVNAIWVVIELVEPEDIYHETHEIHERI
jgi:hypothetical protein